MATSDGTLLCIFSGSDCIIVDDFNQQVQQTIPIKTIWPGLPDEMSSNLDAVCRDDNNGQFIFFKGAQCAVNNFRRSTWANGLFTKFFNIIQNQDGGLDGIRICGSFDGYFDSSVGKPPLRLHAYSGDNLEYMTGSPGDLTDQVTPTNLGGPTPIQQDQGWKQIPGHAEVAASHVFWPTSIPGGTGQLTPAMLVKDMRPDGNTNDNTYQCTFIDSQIFTPLKHMWQGWQVDWTIDAATRVEASMVPPPPPPVHHHHHHHHGHHGHHGPDPILSPNPLCDELPNIMKTICSLTVLMHKALDACYPQSSWPTQPYPDGCAGWGGHKHKHHGCGCQAPKHQPDTPTNS
ncbi:hypothetical protein [Trinickia dinghuensis]|uniref:hypothetical protein n=1 Tax=Trinickia dinghuensis TaxID=2291023 RepID=UPI0015F1A59A|nr:hypothetical protein [Trinickia dinghuensis]